MRIHVRVMPHAGKQGIIKQDETHFLVHLKSPPENNRANVELVKLLQRFFKKKVSIKSGLTSRNKTAEIK